MLVVIWNGGWLYNPDLVHPHPLHFVLQVTKKDFLHKEASINALYNSLNRTILYYLSSYSDEQQRLLEVLHTLQLQWDIIFSIHNSSLEFITCLLYCLLLLKTTR